jgi:hypothetical protein
MEIELRSYRLLQGSHSEGHKTYVKGDLITTTKPLNAIFPDRFEVYGVEKDVELDLGDKFTLSKVGTLFNLVSIKTGYPINNEPMKKKAAYAMLERLNGGTSNVEELI